MAQNGEAHDQASHGYSGRAWATASGSPTAGHLSICETERCHIVRGKIKALDDRVVFVLKRDRSVSMHLP